jgi:hypothetical protein
MTINITPNVICMGTDRHSHAYLVHIQGYALTPLVARITMNKREKYQKIKEMNAKNLLEGIDGKVSDALNNTDLVMVANTQESQEHNNNNYDLCVDSNNIAKKVH